MAEDESQLINGSNCNERTHFGINKSTKYGTTSKKENNFKNVSQENNFFIKYEILKNDTLVSIALKYEQKISQLKSINRMWNSDIIPGQIIFVPLPKSLIIDYKGELFTNLEVKQLLNKNTNSLKFSPDIKPNTSTLDTQNVTINDYFNKFDSNFSQLKTNVERLEKESSLKSLNKELINESNIKLASNIHGNNDISHEPELKFLAQSKSNKAVLMQRKHEEHQDDLFQL